MAYLLFVHHHVPDALHGSTHTIHTLHAVHIIHRHVDSRVKIVPICNQQLDIQKIYSSKVGTVPVLFILAEGMVEADARDTYIYTNLSFFLPAQILQIAVVLYTS